jgi:phosphoglycolate phosphatase
MPYRHVLWDWNGTLLDDLDIVIAAMNELLSRRSLPALTSERYREVFDFPVRRYYEAVGLDLIAEPFPGLAAEWVAAFGGRWRDARLHVGVADALGAVNALGIHQSVLSAAERNLLAEQAEYFGVARSFRSLVGIDDHHAESKVAQGRQWLAAEGAVPNEVLLIGDTTHDVEVAADLGIDTVLVSSGHQSRERLLRTGVPVYATVTEVITALAEKTRSADPEIGLRP